MATSVRVEMNTAGAIAVLKDPAVEADLMRRGQAVAASAGDGHSVGSFTGKTRARVIVTTSSYAARKAESEDRNLTRAIDAARG